MKPSRFTFLRWLLAALVGFGLAAASARAEPSAPAPFAKLVGDVKVGDVAKGDVIQVPYILWGGDVATFLANGGLQTKDGTLFAKQGLKLKLTAGDNFPDQVKDYLSGKSPFLRGTMSMLGLASEVISQDERTKPVIFLQLTWSAGDHLVARAPLKILSDLKGKKIALQKYGPHVGMLDDILRTAKLKWSDVTVVWTEDVTGAKGPSALFKKDNSVDACFAITPDMVELTGGLVKKGTGDKDTIKGAHVLVSTASMKRSIADVYACRKDFYDKNPELVKKFAAGYLKACEELLALKNKAAKKDKDAAAKYKALLKLTQDIYGKEAIKTEDDADGLVSDAVFVGLPGNNSFFTNKGNLSGFEPRMKAALDLAVGEGYVSKRAEMASAQLDYDALKKLGDLQTNTSDRPVDVGEATAIPKDLDDSTIEFFTINFAPNQFVFDEEKYGQDFQRALEQASLFGNAIIAVRGHADITKVMNNFVRLGLKRDIIKRTRSQGKYQYFLKDGTTKFDLSDTKTILALIEKEDFGGGVDDPKPMVKTLLQLSQKRSEAVRDALLKYGASKKILLDKTQIKAVGVGTAEPFVAVPRTNDQMARNRRVEFRILRIKPPAGEATTETGIDY